MNAFSEQLAGQSSQAPDLPDFVILDDEAFDVSGGDCTKTCGSSCGNTCGNTCAATDGNS